MAHKYFVIAHPELLERFSTTHKPWPHHEENSFRLQQQGFVERVFFSDDATIDFDKIPSLQLWSPLVGTTDMTRVHYVVGSLMGVAQLAKRPLTPKEIELTSEFAAFSSRWFPRTTLCAVSAALLCVYHGRNTYRFPFYTPPRGGSFNPSFFPTKKFALVKGQMARYAWHCTRFQFYMLLCYLGFAPFGSSMASMTFNARTMMDNRLESLQEDIRKNIAAQRAAAMNPQQNLPPNQVPLPQEFQESENQAPLQYGRDAYNGPPGNDTGESATGFDGDKPSPTPIASWRLGNPPPASPGGSQGTRFPDPGPRSPDDSDPFGDDDDGSPVPASMRRAEAQQARNSQGGSAWDRLRQQSQSAQSANSSTQEGGWAQRRQARNPQETSSKTEDFTYTKQDEDKERRHYEKEQAQKEFDALLEAERRGGSGRR
ncbi:hypothetical protein F4806DRAFT_472222 [Annulohypoxylon nitens]|nr:hypothetical protein F4806DRAFT_472222 [Annulohypoxylon nitens]